MTSLTTVTVVIVDRNKHVSKTLQLHLSAIGVIWELVGHVGPCFSWVGFPNQTQYSSVPSGTLPWSLTRATCESPSAGPEAPRCPRAWRRASLRTTATSSGSSTSGAGRSALRGTSYHSNVLKSELSYHQLTNQPDKPTSHKSYQIKLGFKWPCKGQCQVFFLFFFYQNV